MIIMIPSHLHAVGACCLFLSIATTLPAAQGFQATNVAKEQLHGPFVSSRSQHRPLWYAKPSSDNDENTATDADADADTDTNKNVNFSNREKISKKDVAAKPITTEKQPNININLFSQIFSQWKNRPFPEPSNHSERGKKADPRKSRNAIQINNDSNVNVNVKAKKKKKKAGIPKGNAKVKNSPSPNRKPVPSVKSTSTKVNHNDESDINLISFQQKLLEGSTSCKTG